MNIKHQSPIRVILIGQPEAGKSTILKCITNKKTDHFPQINERTDGIDVKTKFNFTFWDFGGQELLFTTHQIFLSENCQYILVIDLYKFKIKSTKQECLSYLEYWINELTLYGNKNNFQIIPIIIVATHLDQFKNTEEIEKTKNKLKKHLKKRKLNYYNEEIYSFSKTKRFYKNIQTILTQITKNSINCIRPIQGFKNNNSFSLDSIFYFNLLKQIEIYKENHDLKNKPFMWWNDFINEFFYINNLFKFSKKQINKFISFLKNSGIIIFHRIRLEVSSNIVIFDPKWIARALKSIITININNPFFTQDNYLGYFKKHQIHENLFNEFNVRISDDFFHEILKLFEIFHLIVYLPLKEIYFVPTMIYSNYNNKKPECLGKFKIENLKKQNQNLLVMKREFLFDSCIPFGFIDRLISRILYYPNLTINKSSWKNDYHLIYTCESNCEPIHIMIQTSIEEEDKNNIINSSKLIINIFYNKSISLLENFLLFHFIFNSPFEIIKFFKFSNILQVYLYDDESNFIEYEDILIKNFFKNQKYWKYLLGHFTDTLNYFDSDFQNCEIKYKIKDFENLWCCCMDYKNSDEKLIRPNLILKQLNSFDIIDYRNCLHEIIICKMIDNPFITRLVGICKPSMLLCESIVRQNVLFDTQSYIDHQILLVFEDYFNFGNFIDCKHEINSIHENCTKLKIKIAFDIIRGLQSLFLDSGIKFIHCDINPKNIQIVSISTNENDLTSNDSIHAKLAGFDNIIIGNPIFFERVGKNYKYIAPEVLNNSILISYSREIDIYSFGILFWEILSCKIPFEKKTENQIIAGERPSLIDLPDDVPLEIKQLIKKCWSSDPSERPNFYEIINTLKDYLGN